MLAPSPAIDHKLGLAPIRETGERGRTFQAGSRRVGRIDGVVRAEFQAAQVRNRVRVITAFRRRSGVRRVINGNRRSLDDALGGEAFKYLDTPEGTTTKKSELSEGYDAGA